MEMPSISYALISKTDLGIVREEVVERSEDRCIATEAGKAEMGIMCIAKYV